MYTKAEQKDDLHAMKAFTTITCRREVNDTMCTQDGKKRTGERIRRDAHDYGDETILNGVRANT